MMAAPEKLSLSMPRALSGDDMSRFVPYILVPTLVFTALLWSGFDQESDNVAGLLRGPDDFMRLVQVIDWLDGQSWSDTAQRRLNPPVGVALHWSRLADMPVAAVIWLIEPWFGRTRAVSLSVLLVPSFLGGLFAAVFLWAALSLLPARRALEPPILMVGTLLYPLTQFFPGRVDHHGLQLVLTALVIGLLMRALEPGRVRAAAGLGVAGGLSLTIGLETLPLLGAATVIFSLVWTMRGGSAATSLALFGLALTGTALALLPLTRPRPEWTAVVCDQMSLVHITLTATVLAAGTGAFALERLRPAVAQPARLVLVGGIGLVGLVLAATIFPQCAGVPYTNLSPEVHYWLEAVVEAQSLLETFHHEPGLAVSLIILPLVALVSVVWLIRPAGRTAPHWIALLVLVLSGITTVVWQIRGVSYAGLAASLALTPFADTMNERADRIPVSSVKQLLVRIGLRLCVPGMCSIAVILPLLLLQSASSPAANEQEVKCEVPAHVDHNVVAALNDPTELGAEARTIAAPIDLGPSILLLTRHRVLAAPYHRNIQGLADNRRIFAGTEEDALATVRARAVDAVLFCRKFVPVTTYADQPAFLNERLSAGRPPWWLVPITSGEDMSLYRVHSTVRARH